MRFCLRCILYRSIDSTPYRIPIDEAALRPARSKQKCFTVIEDGVDSSVGRRPRRRPPGICDGSAAHVMAAIVKLPASISACR